MYSHISLAVILPQELDPWQSLQERIHKLFLNPYIKGDGIFGQATGQNKLSPVSVFVHN